MKKPDAKAQSRTPAKPQLRIRKVSLKDLAVRQAGRVQGGAMSTCRSGETEWTANKGACVTGQ